MLDPTPADREALARLRRRERARIFGMVVAAFMLYRMSAGMAQGGVLSPALGAMIALAIVIGLYALWAWARPRDPITALIRLDPEDEIAAGLRLTVDVVLQPRQTLPLDPLEIRLVGRRQAGGHHETVYSSPRTLAARRSLSSDEIARFQASFPIPEDIPLGAPGERVRYRVQVKVGNPAIFSTSRVVRIRPSSRRPRRRGAAR